MINISRLSFKCNNFLHTRKLCISEIEAVTASLNGEELDKSNSKRKKDGVFYTPKFITIYIVENTVGKLCSEKKKELGLNESEYAKGKKNRNKKTISKLQLILNEYKKWLLNLKICDPACGSGAFLNQALTFLINEHSYISELEGKLHSIIHNGATQLALIAGIENQILENNIYGVDINEESVEIAKLSLWLRTAEKGRKLNTLSNNIKCGNSLIDASDVAGDKAFSWRNEFPEIFTNGGFDVVIGNPPYVQSHSISESEKNFIYKNFKTVEYQINTYGVFVEQFINLLKKGSYYSLIIPNYWLSTKFDKNLRKAVFIDNYALELINTFEVFESATVDTLILTGQKVVSNKNKTSFLSISKNLKTINERLDAINLKLWDYTENKQFINGDEEQFISFSNELNLVGNKTLKDFITFKKGMQPYEKGKGTPVQTREMMNEKVYHSTTKIDETYLPLLGAKHIKRNYLAPYEEYIKYGKNLAAPRNSDIFKGERILVNRILSKEKIDGVLVSETFINNTDVFNLLPVEDCTLNIKVLYALVVSKLCASYFKKANVNLNRNVFPKINVNTLETFPVPNITKDSQERIEILIENILSSTSKCYKSISKFIGLFKDNFEIQKVSKKLESFYKLDFKEFLLELKKQKITLSLSDQSEWKDYFEENKCLISQLVSEIEKMDRELDQFFYTLYGLSEEEIKAVEGT